MDAVAEAEAEEVAAAAMEDGRRVCFSTNVCCHFPFLCHATLFYSLQYDSTEF